MVHRGTLAVTLRPLKDTAKSNSISAQCPSVKMDAFQGKVDSIGGEVRHISETLRSYLVDGATGTRKVKPPHTKAGRDLLQHLLARLEQVSTELVDVRHISSNYTNTSSITSKSATGTATSTTSVTNTPSLSLANGPDTPLSYQETSSTPTPATPPSVSADASVSASTTVTADALPGGGQQQPASELASKSCHGHENQVTPVTPVTPITDKGHRSPGPVSNAIVKLTPKQSTPEGAPLDCDGPAPGRPLLSPDTSPLFDCIYQDIHVLNEDLFETFSRHPIVQARGYFKLQVRDLPSLKVEKVSRPSKDHATSFCYKIDEFGLVKVDTGKRPKFKQPKLPFPMSSKSTWSQEEQRDLWNNAARNAPKVHMPYIIGNPLFDDVELSPGEKLRRRGRTVLEGVNTQYVYFNLLGTTITTMHREDAHVRSENLLRSGQNKFWCFVKPSSTAKLEEEMRKAYPEMRDCSQAVRHLSRHIPPEVLDRWGVEYTLDYCVPGQAIVTEPGTYHQVLNLGPNYAIAINLEYNSSPDDPPNYRFCDDDCPDKYAMSAEDFKINPDKMELDDKPSTDQPGTEISHPTQTATPSPERRHLPGRLDANFTAEPTSEPPQAEEEIANNDRPGDVESPPVNTETPTTLEQSISSKPQRTPSLESVREQLQLPAQTAPTPQAVEEQQVPPEAVEKEILPAPLEDTVKPVQALPPQFSDASSQTPPEQQSRVCSTQLEPQLGPQQHFQSPFPLEAPLVAPTLNAIPTLPRLQTNTLSNEFFISEARFTPVRSHSSSPVKTMAPTHTEEQFSQATLQPDISQEAELEPAAPSPPSVHSLVPPRPEPVGAPARWDLQVEIPAPVPAKRASMAENAPIPIVAKSLAPKAKRRAEKPATPSGKKSTKRQKVDHNLTNSQPQNTFLNNCGNIETIPSSIPAPTSYHYIPPIANTNSSDAVTPFTNPFSNPFARPVISPITPVYSNAELPNGVSAGSPFSNLATLLRRVEAPAIEQVCSKAAFLRLAGLVRDWRAHSRAVQALGVSGGGLDLVKRLAEEDDKDGEWRASCSEDLWVFLGRLCKMRIAELVNNNAHINSQATGVDGELEVENELLSQLGWDESRRSTLHDYLREGKCLSTICGPAGGEYDGLLCLLPPDTKFVELALFGDEVALFHVKLGDTPLVRKMCAMGKVLQKSIWGDLELPEFIWEAVDYDRLELEGEGGIGSLLGLFKIIKANSLHKSNREMWSRPPVGWSEERWGPWPPVDVTKATPGPGEEGRYCGLCYAGTSGPPPVLNSNGEVIKKKKTPAKTCRCYWNKVPQIPRISDDGSKGPGVRAVGTYKSGQLLGELVGELVPPGYFNEKGRMDEWTMEFRRPDLRDGEAVAEIWPKETGNWVRKVNHSANSPSAEFRTMKISGRWRVMLVAIRDVRDGEEITARFGRGYVKGEKYGVVEGLH